MNINHFFILDTALTYRDKETGMFITFYCAAYASV